MIQRHPTSKTQILYRVYALILSWPDPQTTEPAADDLGRAQAVGSGAGSLAEACGSQADPARRLSFAGVIEEEGHCEL